MSIAEQVKAARENAVMWQTELAEASGVALRSIAKIEKGKADPKRSTLERLAAALGTTFTIGEAK